MRLFRPALSLALVCVACAISFPQPALATSYVLVADPDLADQAPVIAEVQVVSVDSAPGGERPATDYLVQVERLVKGFVPGSSLVVRVGGGVLPSGLGLHLYGAPRFAAGGRALLFLQPWSDGTYRVLHFMQGAFHVVERQGRRLALRDFNDTQRLDLAGRKLPAPDEVRDLERFSQWLIDRAAGQRREADYQVALPAAEMDQLAGAFTLFSSDGINLRWREFDTDGRVHFLAHEGGQPGLPGGGFAEFQAGLAVWTSDPSTPIRLVYDGTTTANGGLDTFDAVNAILFDNPNNSSDFDAPFGCSTGGVLAVGGPWFRSNTHTFKDTTYYAIVGADIVTNKGISCWIGIRERGSEVFAHELGHTLAIGHSCGDGPSGPCNTFEKDDALMRADAHGDGRGARLGDEDRAAICFVYGPPGCENGGGGGAPAAPSNLAASVLSGSQVMLTWSDNADNETGFRIEIKEGDGSFRTLANVGANVTSYLASGLTSGVTYTFRLRAVGSGGTSGTSNKVTVTTPSMPPPAAPTGLTATALSTSQVQLAWQDLASNETGFEVEASSGGAFSTVKTAAANAAGVVVTGLLQYTEYTFRVRAVGAGGASAYSPTASALTLPLNTATPAAPSRLLVIPTSNGSAHVTWQDNASNELGIQVERRAGGGAFQVAGTLGRNSRSLDDEDLTPGVEYTYRVRALGASEDSAYSDAVVTELITPGSTCSAGQRRACLLAERFQVEVQWRNQRNGEVGFGNRALVSDQTSSFWFFRADNTELILKLVDGSAKNGFYWVFFGALTDLEYWVTVSDTVTGEVKAYHNEPGSICGEADTKALPAAGGDAQLALAAGSGPDLAQQSLWLAAPAPLAGTMTAQCTADADTLCLLDDRVKVEVFFRAPNGQQGAATAVPGTDRTGLFWFFRQENIELVVKALDGSASNGRIWIFWGALTNVYYELTVTDTTTGATKTYVNQQGNVCGGADTQAL